MRRHLLLLVFELHFPLICKILKIIFGKKKKKFILDQTVFLLGVLDKAAKLNQTVISV